MEKMNYSLKNETGHRQLTGFRPVVSVKNRRNIAMMLMLTVAFALSSVFTVKADTKDFIKDKTLGFYDFLGTTHSFTTANSNISGNQVGSPTLANGYMFTDAGGSGNRGTKITNMTATDDRQDTVYYEFDWNPYKLLGQTNSSGTAGIEPASFGACIVRGSNDSIVFGLWYERWSLLPGSRHNTDSVNAQPLGDLHLMNKSTDPYNPMPAQIVTRTIGGVDYSYYTNTLVPFAMLEPGTTNYYSERSDSINQSTDIGKTFKMSRWYRIRAVIDFKFKRIISFEIYEKANPDNKATFTDLPFVNTGANNVSRLEIAGTRGKREGSAANGSNTNYQQQFDNFDIYTMREVAQAATVTIKYVDDNGAELKPSRTVPYLEVGTEFTVFEADKVTIVIGDDYYVYDPTSVSTITLVGGANEIVLKFKKAIPTATVVTITAPSTSELYKDVKFDISVKTPAGDPVGMGHVLFMVNNIAKNRLDVDVLGTASLVMPNLLVGDAQIAALYVGDRINYSNSDTARTVVTIAPSTATVKPYPVYFDLVDQPEIAAWDRERGMTTATPRGYSKTFSFDSLPGIMVSDTLSTHRVGYYYAGSTYDKIDNAYNRADFVTVPLGSSRPTWVRFNTPWLNEGSYNIYISHRVSGDPKTNMTTIDMNGKELYFPNHEMYGRWFKSWMGVNNRRRWNATGNSGSMGMNYIGSVSVDKSGTQQLTINVAPENGATYNLDMLQFIPVDMDSLDINQTAATSMGKNYFPMFDWLGFAQMQLNDGTFNTTYADFTEFAVPYQVVDQTEYTKYPFTIADLGIKVIGDDMLANYCIVYRKEDKWTRVAEGAIENNAFAGELPMGDYYYQEINYIDMGIPGAAGYRTFVSDGYFSVGPSSVTDVKATKEVYAYAVGSKLLVKGMNAGDRVLIYDVAGKQVLNSLATSNSFETQLKSSAYIVKVLSAQKGTHVMKVMVR